MAIRVRVIGVHPVMAHEPVHLVEIEVEGSTQFDLNSVTQEVEGQPQSNWQAPYDERRVKSEPGRVSFAFFFHYLDLAKPLLSLLGPLDLPPESPIPEHLRGIRYEQP